MLELPQKSLNNIKRVLLRQKKKLSEDLKNVAGDDPVKIDGLAESSEPGTDSWMAEQHTKAVALGSQLKNMTFRVTKALQKIRKGSFGTCEKCGKQIEMGRLLSFPAAEYCLSCSQKSAK